ncbi:MAG TPA: protease pro-enzyme activation domain-containing protein, partial [Candidatus Binataceae bacterium]|nr:protease pro-enzyme activation domain-containing protein [Candidatus Binataceae bacterium]
MMLCGLIAPQWLYAQSVTVTGNRSAVASALTSHAASTQPLTVHITFKPRNRAAMLQLLADQQDKKSPRYHKWLKRGEFNRKFGRTPAEVEAVSKWLTGSGLRVTRSTNREIVAGATVATAEAAFATTIAASPDGSTFANNTEPQIPAQFADVIGSIDGLENVHRWTPIIHRINPDASPKPAAAGISASPQAQPAHHAAAARSAPAVVSSPAYKSISFGPQDLWTFYDETPPLNGATDGSGGDCIGIVEDSDYLDSAVTLFNTTFSLPTTTVTRVFADVTTPGKNSDEGEALLDIQWAHAVAPGAPENIYIGAQNSNTVVDSLSDPIIKAIDDDSCSAVSFSYVFCGATATFYSQTLGNPLIQ